jgi:acyl-ACP--UDP-N-acetylglucosamine O-acyltransferase
VGDHNHFFSYVTIGALGENGVDVDKLVENGEVKIGNHTTLREFVCVHSPLDTHETRIDDKVYIMNKVYVAHDCRIGQGTAMSAGAMLGGNVVIGECVNLGLGATVHQGLHIGSYAMIGMQTPVTRDVLPYSTVAGSPARIIGFNRKGGIRNGFEQPWLDEMEWVFKKDIQLPQNSNNPMIKEMMSFYHVHPESLIRIKT